MEVDTEGGPSVTVHLWPGTYESGYLYCLGVDQISKRPLPFSSGAGHPF